MSLISIYVSFTIVAMVTAPLIFKNIVQIICAHVDSLASKFCSLDLYPCISSLQTIVT